MEGFKRRASLGYQNKFWLISIVLLCKTVIATTKEQKNKPILSFKILFQVPTKYQIHKIIMICYPIATVHYCIYTASIYQIRLYHSQLQYLYLTLKLYIHTYIHTYIRIAIATV